MPWYHHIAAFLRHNLTHMRATKRANLALLTATILNRRPSPYPNWRGPGCPHCPKATTRSAQKSTLEPLSLPLQSAALTPSKPNAPRCLLSATWPASKAKCPL